MKNPRNTRTKTGRLAVIYSDTPERRVLDLSRSGLPEVPALGLSRYGHVIAPSG